MKKRNAANKRGTMTISLAVLFVLALFPLASIGRAPATSLNIVNNSTRTIRNVYLSHVGSDDWGSNQLGNSVISPSQSFQLSNISCDSQQIQVIAEDEDGCFLSTPVTCEQSSSWTVTNDTARDCGGSLAAVAKL